MKVYFIGAGPGDPELITIKGKRIIESSGYCIYAGSLVNKEILKYCREDTKIYDSAPMALEEIIKVMEDAKGNGYRCCTGSYRGSINIRGYTGANVRTGQT